MSSLTCSTTVNSNVFETGKYPTVVQKVEAEETRIIPVPPPKPLLIATPSEEGKFPVLVFSHGYLLYNSFYSQLLQHVASHGFIVIAPQLYTVAGPDSSEEIKSTAEVTNWLSKGLETLLPPQVKPDLTKVGLAGHSRGGKTSFALALSKEPRLTTLKFSVLIGIDPVDGMDKGKQTPPPVLTYVPRSFDLGMPVMVIGSGLGEVKRNPLFPPCAPRGVNHEDFFRECREPAWYFVVEDFGHLDVLDDETKGFRGKASYCLCKNGKSREPMRRFVGGVVVAFMKAYLEGDLSSLVAIRDRGSGAEDLPVELKTVEVLL